MDKYTHDVINNLIGAILFAFCVCAVVYLFTHSPH